MLNYTIEKTKNMQSLSSELDLIALVQCNDDAEERIGSWEAEKVDMASERVIVNFSLDLFHLNPDDFFGGCVTSPSSMV